MATSQQFIVADVSTYANYYAWASAVSAFLASVGWLQGTDTGQIMWTGLSISAVAMSGSNMTCTYSGLTGLALAVGRTLTITGWTGGNVGNNGTFRITAIGSGTFTCVNASGVNVASGGTGVVTQSSTAPTTLGTFNYEIWHPGDGLQDFVLKLETGNGNVNSGTTYACPTFRLTLAAGTNGAGSLTGFTTTAYTIASNSSNQAFNGAPSATIAYECDFSGDSGRLSILMWRNKFYQGQWFGVQRSLNSSGSTTASYVSLFGFGNADGLSNTGAFYSPSGFQTSLHFTYGILGTFQRSWDPGGANANNNGMPIPLFNTNWTTTLAAGGQIPIWFLSPCATIWDYPCTVIGVAPEFDFTDGVPVTITNQYGQTKTYMVTKCAGGSRLATTGGGSASFPPYVCTALVEYD